MTTLSEIKARDADCDPIPTPETMPCGTYAWAECELDRRQLLDWLERGRKFLAHRETCNVAMFIPPGPCNCGFDDYVKELYRE